MFFSFVCFFIGRAYIWYKNYQLRKKEKASERRASNTWAQDAAAVAVTPQPVMQQTSAASVAPPAYPAPSPAQSIAGMAANLTFINASAYHGTIEHSKFTPLDLGNRKLLKIKAKQNCLSDHS